MPSDAPPTTPDGCKRFAPLYLDSDSHAVVTRLQEWVADTYARWEELPLDDFYQLGTSFLKLDRQFPWWLVPDDIAAELAQRLVPRIGAGPAAIFLQGYSDESRRRLRTGLRDVRRPLDDRIAEYRQWLARIEEDLVSGRRPVKEIRSEQRSVEDKLDDDETRLAELDKCEEAVRAEGASHLPSCLSS